MFFSIPKKIEFKIDNNKLKSKAHQNPPTLKPSTSLSARKMIITFITNRNNPKVTMVTGSVRITNMGRTIAFRIPKTSATIKAVA